MGYSLTIHKINMFIGPNVNLESMTRSQSKAKVDLEPMILQSNFLNVGYVRVLDLVPRLP